MATTRISKHQSIICKYNTLQMCDIYGRKEKEIRETIAAQRFPGFLVVQVLIFTHRQRF